MDASSDDDIDAYMQRQRERLSQLQAELIERQKVAMDALIDERSAALDRMKKSHVRSVLRKLRGASGAAFSKVRVLPSTRVAKPSTDPGQARSRDKGNDS